VTQQSGRWGFRCRYPVLSTVLLVSWRVVVVSRHAWLDDARLLTVLAHPPLDAPKLQAGDGTPRLPGYVPHARGRRLLGGRRPPLSPGNGLRAVVMLGLSSGSSGVKGRDPRVGESGEAEYHTNRAAGRGPDLRPPLGLSLAAGSRVAV
jgi:hypothetical protein